MKYVILSLSIFIFVVFKSFIDNLIFSYFSKRNLRFDVKNIFYEENILLLLIFIDKYFALLIYSILILKNGGMSVLKSTIYDLGYKKALKISVFTLIFNILITLVLFISFKFILTHYIILIIFLGMFNYTLLNLIPFPMFDMFNIMIFYASNSVINIVYKLNYFPVFFTYLLMFLFDKFAYIPFLKWLYI